jgi:hypothetical protein
MTEDITNDVVIQPPLIFLSHDSRDAELAEAFSRLLKSVSAGMLKTFRSSDKTGSEGIEFGDDWYKRLMAKLDSASDVVCLLTERSIDRPWILYETGVAKGKMNTPVHGVALGIPLGQVSTGPFYQFQNSDDSEEALTKLVLQLCQRVPALEPDEGVVRNQVKTFKEKTDEVLEEFSTSNQEEEELPVDQSAVAKMLEEMKLLVRELPMDMEKKLTTRPNQEESRAYKLRPELFDEFIYDVASSRSDPIIILFMASFFRYEIPWLYEIGLVTYQTITTASMKESLNAIEKFRDSADRSVRFLSSRAVLARDYEFFSFLEKLPLRINQYMRYFKKDFEINKKMTVKDDGS